MSQNIIAKLNDQFRNNLELMALKGQVLITCGVAGMSENDKTEILQKVIDFNEFNPEKNDPYGEHDFGSFVQNEEKIFWKIDCYDKNLEYGSPDPADESKTKRILTIMQACEY